MKINFKNDLKLGIYAGFMILLVAAIVSIPFVLLFFFIGGIFI